MIEHFDVMDFVLFDVNGTILYSRGELAHQAIIDLTRRSIKVENSSGVYFDYLALDNTIASMTTKSSRTTIKITRDQLDKPCKIQVILQRNTNA